MKRCNYALSAVITAALLLTFFFLLSNPALAVIQGPCANCHTMHNSQGNLPMNYSNDFDTAGQMNENLLRASCLGCHAQGGSALETLGTDTVPQVYHTDLSNNLAGGNFYYVQSMSAAKGHNIEALTGTDSALLYPPGGIVQSFHNGPGSLVTTANLTCASSQPSNDRGGCHGNRSSGQTEYVGVSGAHHDNLGGAVDPASNDPAPGHSYRFLLGVKGYESADWEYNETIGSHNEYFGVDEPLALGCFSFIGCHGTGGVRAPSGTISQFCATCHGNFHTLRTTSSDGVGDDAIAPFIRHPTDLAMPSGGEYSGYTTYSLQAPVARPTVYAAPNAVVNPGTDIVMCLSCHYSHGSEYDDMLRWDYTTMVAGGGGSGGCFTCHSTKN